MAKDKIKNLEIPISESEQIEAVRHFTALKSYFDNQNRSDKEAYQALALISDKLGILWNDDNL